MFIHPHADPTTLSFSERYGFKPRPRNLRPREFPRRPRVALWNALYEEAFRFDRPTRRFLIQDGWELPLSAALRKFKRTPLFALTQPSPFTFCKGHILNRPPTAVLQLLEFLVQQEFQRAKTTRLAARLQAAFEEHRMPYTIDVSGTPEIRCTGED